MGTTTACCGSPATVRSASCERSATSCPPVWDVRSRTVYMAQAGPVPHLPEDGKVVTFRPNSPTVRDVATGSRLPVDVEFGPRHRLYAPPGVFPPGNPEGSPALPNTGAFGQGQPGRHLQRGHRPAEPADLAGVHRQDRLRRHPRRRDLEDQGRLGRLGPSSSATTSTVERLARRGAARR